MTLRSLLTLSGAALVLAGVPVDAAQIRGRATDVSGGALPGARIVLENLATGAQAVTTTDAEGRYEFGGLSVGPYRATAVAAGFSEAAQAVSLASETQDSEVNFALALGHLQASVTVTATRNARDTLAVPLRAESIGREQMRSANPGSTGELMVQAPGITPVASGPFQMRPRLRGLDSTRVLILVDGERLNNARTATDRAGVEVGLVDASSVESVEVVSGSGSVLYGTDALSGTINIVTARPNLADSFRVTGGLDGYYTSNERGRRGAFSLGASGPRLALTFAGGLDEFDDYRSGGEDGSLLEDSLDATGVTLPDRAGLVRLAGLHPAPRRPGLRLAQGRDEPRDQRERRESRQPVLPRAVPVRPGAGPQRHLRPARPEALVAATRPAVSACLARPKGT